MKKTMSILALSAFIAAPLSAHAGGLENNIAIIPNVGTMGIGGLVSLPLVRHTLNIDFGFSGFSHDVNFHADGTKFHSELRLGGAPIIFNYFPFHNNFSLNAGFFINRNRVTARGVPGDTGYTINGNYYSAEEVGDMSGRTRFKSVAPYVGIGYGDPFEGGRWSFITNIGAIYEGSPGIRLNADGAAHNAALANDITHLQHKLDHEVRFLNWWPVATVGIAYRF